MRCESSLKSRLRVIAKDVVSECEHALHLWVIFRNELDNQVSADVTQEYCYGLQGHVVANREMMHEGQSHRDVRRSTLHKRTTLDMVPANRRAGVCEILNQRKDSCVPAEDARLKMALDRSVVHIETYDEARPPGGNATV